MCSYTSYFINLKNIQEDIYMANKIIDLTGQKFGEWTVLKKSTKRDKRGIFWTCQCSCGLIKDICGTDLRQGKTTKCKNHKSNLQRDNPKQIQ